MILGKKDFIIFFFCCFLTAGFFNWIDSSYKKTHPLVESNDQSNYFELKDIAQKHSARVLYQSDLGRDRQLVNLQYLPGGMSVDIRNFSIGNSWSRPISWHISSKGQGSIKIRFPANSVTHVALYMSDGDSVWRMSRISTGEEFYTADQLHNGKWLVIPTSQLERERGYKFLELIKLTGNSVSVSALALLGEQK